MHAPRHALTLATASDHLTSSEPASLDTSMFMTALSVPYIKKRLRIAAPDRGHEKQGGCGRLAYETA
tara:strand:+ start:7531 stop:7731 length:201 start_codon:yes stop_codon:yes gene_type:complete